MLETKAAFPYPGSTGYLKPQGDPVRIIQRRADGRLLVQKLSPVQHLAPASSSAAVGGASRTLTAPAADVCERQIDAIETRAQQRRRAA
ncbi:hypothetical protein [Croceicoccus naphthovorans]|uniref:Uncharacterized protein n=1 Tax=Croceicoccus naphthovorans TaxID=1348774 RepID=A0A0G3XE76_9SPHN|nr:hypothetical protein [Croceicoccus naphthovorans]AKM09850.1 hypothetical protein AB433_07420 [Croceicoccus naphthovorans]MBB3991299.1 hypothetical protein [Croceicoccus naphthovorans]